jgi:Gpi18-like mannosyltransferase
MVINWSQFLNKILQKEIFFLLIFSRIVLFGIGELSYNIFPKFDQPPEYVKTKQSAGWESETLKLPQSLKEIDIFRIDHWHRFDSLAYEDIALHGYPKIKSSEKHLPNNWVYFPLYPFLLWLFSKVIPIRIAGVILSNTFFYFALLFLYRFIEKQYPNRQLGHRAVFYALIFPTGLYFSVAYTESLFLFLTVAGFYFMYQKRYGLTCLLAGLATVTRVPGFILSGTVILKYLMDVRRGEISIRDIKSIYFLLIPIPFLIFLLYSWDITGDFLAPFHEQINWGGKSLVFPLSIFARYVLRNPYFIVPGGWDLGILSFLVSGASFLTLLLGIKRITRWMFLYSLALFLLIFSTTGYSFTSINRYIAVIFPLYIIWASCGENRIFDRVFTVISVTLWSFYIISFVNNYYFVI